MSFQVGDVIRNKNPYFGESIWRIDDQDGRQYYVIQGPGRYGLWDSPKYRRIMFKHEMKYYRFATLFERVYLYCLGIYL